MEPSRIEQREELLLSLQELLAPLKELVESDDPRDYQRAAIVRHDFHRDLTGFFEDLRAYCRMGDRVFDWELANLQGRVQQFLECLLLLGRPDNIPTAQQKFDQTLTIFKKELRSLPCDDHATVIPPASPFSAARRIRAICREAQTRIELFDAWLSADVFHRYLPVIPRDISFTVVTKEPSAASSNKKDLERWEGVKAAVQLVEVEFPRFRLLVSDALHDRWLRVDDAGYHLGGSVKDAGKNAYYTISTLDPSHYPLLDEVIAKAKSWK